MKRRCCICKETKPVVGNFTPSNKRCNVCAPIYYAKLRERRESGEPPMQRRKTETPQPLTLVDEFRLFLFVSSTGGGDGNAPARA